MQPGHFLPSRDSTGGTAPTPTTVGRTVAYTVAPIGAAGFTLVELGIVIGVIATLATTVLLGTGFLDASRTAKVCENVAAVRRGTSFYFAQSGGQSRNPSVQLLAQLQQRGFISFGSNSSPVKDFLFRRAAHDAGADWFLLDVRCPTSEACDDVWSQFLNDPALIVNPGLRPPSQSGGLGGGGCPGGNCGAPLGCRGPWTRAETHGIYFCFRV